MQRLLLSLAAIAVVLPAAAQPIVLKFNSPAPPRSFLHEGAFTPWAKAVSEDSAGTLQVETYFGGTLGNFGVTYDRVVDGVADIGFILTAFAGGKFRSLDVAALPFESKSSLAASNALWHLYEKGMMASEFDAVKPLGIWTFPNAALNAKGPVKSLDDLKGRKITVSNAIAGRTVGALGAAAVSLRPDEVYQAMSRGIADMALMPLTGVATFKVYEVAPSSLDVAMGADSAMVFIGRKRWESLPAQARAAIEKHSYLAFSRKLGQVSDAEWNRSRGALKDIQALPAAEEARWKALVAPVAEQWARETPNGAQVLQAFRAEISAFEAKNKGK
jgi:TRAP-type C4-dicarboxylate transport system substrate-binding protein